MKRTIRAMVCFSSVEAISDITRRLQAIPDNTFTVPNNKKQYQSITNNSKQFQTVPNSSKQFQTIPNKIQNTKKIQTIPNNTCNELESFGIANTSVFTYNMIPVLSLYCHNMVLRVLCLSGILTIPIFLQFSEKNMYA